MASCCMHWPVIYGSVHTHRWIKLWAQSARCTWAMAVHHAVDIGCQRNSGYRPSRVNIMAQGLSIPDPSLSPAHLSIRTGCATTTHYTHHQVSLMVLRNTTQVPSLGLRTGPVCEAGLSAGMCATQNKRRKKEGDKQTNKTDKQSNRTSPLHKAPPLWVGLNKYVK